MEAISKFTPGDLVTTDGLNFYYFKMAESLDGLAFITTGYLLCDDESGDTHRLLADKSRIVRRSKYRVY
jgi:hypothetical protein